jgi:hypothetical protein
VPEQRVVAGQAEQAIAKRDQAVIGHVTPHTLRRTFASIVAEVGVPPRAMHLLGDTDPTLTMRVYQQVLDMGGAAVGQIKGVLGCMIQEAFVSYSGGRRFKHPMGTGPEPSRRTAASRATETPSEAL